jgi:hypothetical protein
MKKSEGSIIRQYERDFRAYGIEVTFEDTALRTVAERASEEKTGARGLLTVCEKILRDFKYELPGMGVTQLAVDAELMERPSEVLQRLVEQGRERRVREEAATVRMFAERFSKKMDVRMQFTDDAVAQLMERSEIEKLSVGALCEKLFKDYEYGLKLVQRNDAPMDFLITAEAVEDPDRFLSDWLVKTYRDS